MLGRLLNYWQNHKADHIIWKKRLLDILTGSVKALPEELSNEKVCRLGKWYHSTQADPYRKYPAFQEIEAPHRAVHQLGIEAVRLYNSGQFDEAMRRVEDVEKASQQVVTCLDRMIQETNAKPA